MLQAAGAVIASGALAAGGLVLYDRRRRFGREAERTVRDHRVPLPASAPRMVITRGDDPARNVRAAVERLGSMGQFVSPDDVVLIKPNVAWDRAPEQAANTQPEVVAELVRACRAAGAKRVMVSDCPVRDARRSFERSGILQAAHSAGAEVVLPENSRYHTVRLSSRLGTWEVLEPFTIATKIINAPIVKHHSQALVTGGMKNWIGITDKLRILFHTDLDRSIAELAALMRPTLTVLDATRVLMRHGPEGGNLADVRLVNTVAASVDPVALDAWACELLGARPDSLPGFLRLGERMGLGHADYRTLQPVELSTG
jgi:uncharacterized protein (DUF362 family)